MNKTEFLLELAEQLSPLPFEEIEDSRNYYSEMIDDRMEDGLSEGEAVAAVGDPGEIAAQILAEVPLGKLVKATLKSRPALRAWEIVLLVLGSPVWIPLLAAALVIILAVYLVIWSLVLSLCAADLSLAASAAACVAAAVPFAVGGRLAVLAFALGAGLILAGLAVLLFLGCKRAAKASLWLGKVILRGIRSCFIGKEAAK